MPIGCVYKTRTKHASKGGIELAVFKAFRDVLSFGLGVAELVLVHLLVVLLVDGFSLGHSVIYGDDGATANKHKQAKHKIKNELKEKKGKKWKKLMVNNFIRIWEKNY